jgi:hypothetical protein
MVKPIRCVRERETPKYKAGQGRYQAAKIGPDGYRTLRMIVRPMARGLVPEALARYIAALPNGVRKNPCLVTFRDDKTRGLRRGVGMLAWVAPGYWWRGGNAPAWTDLAKWIMPRDGEIIINSWWRVNGE